MAQRDKKAIPLFLFNEEISLTEYKKKYGEDALFKHPNLLPAERIARATINPLVTETGGINPSDFLLLEMFKGENFFVTVDRVTGGEAISMRGSITGTVSGTFFLSAVNGKVLATIENVEMNCCYTLKFNQKSSCHYLFKSPLDRISQLEDGPSLIPPEDDGKIF